MSDIAANTRLQELLELARNASRLHNDMAARGDSTSDVDDALTAIYADIGKLVYQLLAEDKVAEAEPPQPLDPTAEPSRATFLPLPDEEPEITSFTDEVGTGATSWYTEEMEVEVSGPLFSPDDHLDEFTDIPESDPISEEIEMDAEPDDDGGDYDIASIGQMWSERVTRGRSLHDLADPTADPTWNHKLTQLLGLLNLPDDFTGNDEMAVEASRVQWAASELGNRLDGFPEAVQLCIIGMLAARAQHLRSQLAVDVGPRLAIDRLRRYRIDNELPTVAGLLSQPVPETGSWVSDIEDWWKLLQGSDDEIIP